MKPQVQNSEATDRPSRIAAGADAGAADAYWREIVTQIGSDVAATLSSALERVNTLAATGRIDRQGLRGLREEIETARRVGMIGQQLIRVASGRIRQQSETIDLTTALRELINQRRREATSRAIELSQSLRPAEVVVDATLLYALLQALVDWIIERARERIEFRLDVDGATARARVTCRFRHRRDSDGDGLVPLDVDTMTWRLAAQIASVLGLPVERRLGNGESEVLLWFPHTVNEQVAGLSAVELDAGFAATANSMPLAGMHVLVLAARRDVRATIREAVRHMGLVLDFVPTLEEAEHFCASTLPHAIVYESMLGGRRLERLREGILAEVPKFAFIEVSEEGRDIEFAAAQGGQPTRIGRDALLESLPSALFFELSAI